MLPVATNISIRGDTMEFLYSCPKCGASFHILKEKEHYCHNCGKPVSWKYCRQPFCRSESDHGPLDIKKELDKVNRENRARKARKKEIKEESPMLPIATDISGWNDRTEIIYSCGNCGQDFRMFMDREQYCHRCGKRVDWGYCRRAISHPLEVDAAWEDIQETLAVINKQNKKRQKKDESVPDVCRAK
jgi:DNA-directed RNA polymerase subunit RPC12/RpoP